MSDATPAITPTTEMPVITPMTACLRLARRYRDAMKSSNLTVSSCRLPVYQHIIPAVTAHKLGGPMPLIWLIIVSGILGWLLGLATSFLVRRRLRRER